MKSFNVTGTCFPSLHYMVDITKQVNDAIDLVSRNLYFCINRGRQYGKTTTLEAIRTKLQEQGYCVFFISFEGLDDDDFVSLKTLLAKFMSLLNEQLYKKITKNISQSAIEKIAKFDSLQEVNSTLLIRLIFDLCSENNKIVLIIDEVDQASNHDSFIKFLGILRRLFLDRIYSPTFYSVILAGVYDITNLKLKIRPNEEHSYNSPWNIASDYSSDMSLPVDGIEKMLIEYKSDRNIDFDAKNIAKQIYDWTSGYPYLVSKICLLIDTKNLTWDNHGINEAIKFIFNDSNDKLFLDFSKKINDFPNLTLVLRQILFNGDFVSYSLLDNDLRLALRFNYVKNINNQVVISNRIFELALYNFFISEEKKTSIYAEGEKDKNQFIKDGYLDLKHVLEKFAVHFNEIYGKNDDKFVENQGRKLFLLYLRPIINGIGNYYIEAQTRDYTRTDIIIDYKSKQYVVELKIWHGEEYNRKGEIQLTEYLNYFNLQEGYMVSFCFNKNKQTGLQEVNFGDKKLYEVVV
ncbi:MAG: ATP-binding protein [Bacteroidales bacterium]|nr:ATP-binding protein [Bacteroidales bacterium]